MHQGPPRRRLDADSDTPHPAKQVHGRTPAPALFFLLILATIAIDTNCNTVIGELGDSLRQISVQSYVDNLVGLSNLR